MCLCYLASPSVNFPSKEFFVEEGREMVIPCPITTQSSEGLTIDWYKNGVAVQNSRDIRVNSGRFILCRNSWVMCISQLGCVYSIFVARDIFKNKVYSTCCASSNANN